MIRLINIGSAALCLVFFCTAAAACTCASTKSPGNMRAAAAERAESAATVIFEGTVEKQSIAQGTLSAPSNALSMTAYDSHRIVRIAVARVYQGKLDKRAIIVTGIGNGDCGFDFENGEKYLVYADRSADGQLQTSICSGTSPIRQAGPALRFLRHEQPEPDDFLDPKTYYAKHASEWTATLCGRVMSSNGEPVSNAILGVARVRDKLFVETQSEDVISDQDGGFCLTGIAAGKYLVHAEKYDYAKGVKWTGYYSNRQFEPISTAAKPGQTQSSLDIRLQKQQLYQIRIRIGPSGRRGIPSQQLGVILESADSLPFGFRANHQINEDGTYIFGQVPAGRYVVWGTITDEQLHRVKIAQTEVEVVGDTEIVLDLASTK